MHGQLLIGLGLAGTVSMAAQATIVYYVDDDLVEYPNADFTHIQDAIDAANPGGGYTYIWVAPGSYGPTNTAVFDPNGEQIVVQTDPTIVGQRIIYGQGVAMGVQCQSGESLGDVLISGLDFRSCSPAIHCSNNSTLSLSDCTVDSCGGTLGGGASVKSGSDLHLFNVDFSLCSAWYGGGIYVSDGQVNVDSDCEITDCSVSFSGGGIYADANAAVRLGQDVTISNCSAGYGGGVALDNGSTLTSDPGSGTAYIIDCVAAYGGGVHAVGASHIDLQYTAIDRCHATNGTGGGLYLKDGVDILDVSTLKIVEGRISECSALLAGGGIAVREALSLEMDSIEVSDNQTGPDGSGGGLYIFGIITATITECELSMNHATTAGGLLAVAVTSLTVEDSVMRANAAVPYPDEEGTLIANGSACRLGVYASTDHAYFDNVEFRGNSLPSTSYSGVIEVGNSQQANVHLLGCTFCGNTPSSAVTDYLQQLPVAWDDQGGNTFPGDCGGCTGDIDGDGAVTALDLVALLWRWDDVDDYCDYDQSGEVDTQDLLVMLHYWGDCPP